MGFIQEFEARGEARGLVKGRAEGEVKGEAKALVRLLEKHFGAATVTAEFRNRIFAADVATLEAWLDRAIDADKLSAVFDTLR
jgi:predicted transposase YdaD